jgi:hypothetical protein
MIVLKCRIFLVYLYYESNTWAIYLSIKGYPNLENSHQCDVIEWIRTTHGFFIKVDIQIPYEYYSEIINIKKENFGEGNLIGIDFKNPYDANSNAIDYILKVKI